MCFPACARRFMPRAHSGAFCRALIAFLLMRATTGFRAALKTPAAVGSLLQSNAGQKLPLRMLLEHSRRGFVGRWLGLGTLLTGVAGSFARPASASAGDDVAVKSSMGLDLRPMTEAEVTAATRDFTPLQQKVLLRAGTEMAFTGSTVNGYGHATKDDGIWVSAASGVPVFDSKAKFESGTGWPSFFAPVDPAHIIERLDPKDSSFLPKFMQRVEVLDRKSGTHLGHVFDDGPRPTGKRYCMNAAALRFVPRSEVDDWLKKLPKA